MEASSESTTLNKLIKLYLRPENLDIRVPKLNKEIELNTGFQKNVKYVNSKEKALYATQNYVAKGITIFSKIGHMILEESDKCDTGSSFNYKELVQMCVHGSTLLGHVQAELSQKRKNNIRNIVNSSYAALCGPRPGSQTGKRKPKNVDSEYLLGDNLKPDAKMAKTASDMFRASCSATITSSGRRGHSNYEREDAPKNDFLYYGRKQNGQRRSREQFSTKDYNKNRTPMNKKKN